MPELQSTAGAETSQFVPNINATERKVFNLCGFDSILIYDFTGTRWVPMAYTLIAFVINANGIGELEKKTFDSVSAAEERMKRWGRYGVEGQCDQPSELAIFDAEGEVVRSWNWRRREPFDPRVTTESHAAHEDLQ